MIGIVMAGGQGTRMESNQEKLLLKYKKPVILHVIDALRDSESFSKILAITSPHTPKTKELLKQTDVEIVETPGNGYVRDLNQVLSSIDDYVLVTSGDLPFLDAEIIKQIVALFNPENVWMSIVVTNEFLDSLHILSDYLISYNGKQCFFTGISLVNAKQIKNLNQVKETYHILDDKRVAFNLNTKQDYELLGIS
ncbi:MAG: 5-deoxyadenosylcobinamide phosphate nucleotidyltransferase [Nitrosopumilales archaeon]|nr:MAG: 5-deoxyadenosylcobinamide phosphate nucleotidyltransferase [Nitrosopumilales archaeon]